jgi:hypothetical protein
VSTRAPYDEGTRGPGPRVLAGQARRDTTRLRAMIVLILLVVASATGVLLILRADANRHSSQATPASCTNVAKTLTKAAIRVRVLNATAREGLATTVAAELRRRGYTVTTVGNDSTVVPGPAMLRYGAGGAPAAKAMTGLVTGAVNRPVTRAGADVDLVLGNTFTRLAPAVAAPAKAAAGCPETATTAR